MLFIPIPMLFMPISHAHPHVIHSHPHVVHAHPHVASHVSAHVVAHTSASTSHIVASHASHVTSTSPSVHAASSHVIATPPSLVLPAALLHHVHFLLAQRLLHLKLSPLDRVLPDQDNLVHSVVIVKLNEPKASLLSSVVPLQLLHVHNLSKVLKVGADVIVLHLVADTSDEDLLYTDLGLGLASIAARGGTFCLQGFVIDLMRSVRLALIQPSGCRVGDKAKASGPAGIVELHNDAVDEFAKAFKMGTQLVLGGGVAEASDEQLSHGLGLRIEGLVIVVPAASSSTSATAVTSSTSSSSSPTPVILPGGGSFQFNSLAVKGVGRRLHAVLQLVLRGESDEAKATTAPRVWKLHHHKVGQLAPLAEVRLQLSVRRVIVEPADKQLAGPLVVVVVAGHLVL